MNRGCATKRRELSEPLRVEPQEAAVKRSRRLGRGIDRFVRDVRNDGIPIKRVQLVALTVRDLDATTADGSVRELMHQVRKLGPGLRYFWWAEFQRRGAIHFHMIWLDSPFRTTARAKAWLRRHWSHASIWPSVHKRDDEWFGRSAGAYVGNYAKKLGDKSYQQEYDLMPKGWHTFATHRLAFPIAEHELHEHQAVTVNLALGQCVPWYQRLGQTWVIAVDYHHSAAGGCHLDMTRRRPRKLAAPRAAARSVAAAARRGSGSAPHRPRAEVYHQRNATGGVGCSTGAKEQEVQNNWTSCR